MDKAFDLLLELESRLLKASALLPLHRPWVEEERKIILESAGNCLGIRDELIPSVRLTSAEEICFQGFTVEKLGARSWEKCSATAHLYLPASKKRMPHPLLILCCGHGKNGKRNPGYQSLARMAVQRGAAVLIPDNIGQGEREPMGHSSVVAPFERGLSLQGLIVMETMGWLDWARRDGRFDVQRIAAAGNSGGGTLALFLGALRRNELAALSSSGYPSTFEFIARKEKTHCHCNILPGIVGAVEMWQLYGCFAPRPMFLFQGKLDSLFPEDIFDAVCRKVSKVYREHKAEGALRVEIFPGEHSWDDERRVSLTEFLSSTLGLEEPADRCVTAADPGNCYETWPEDALTADELALRITCSDVKTASSLYDVYGAGLVPAGNKTFRRVDIHQLIAQFQAFLPPHMRLGSFS